jgi:hypothetical protein
MELRNWQKVARDRKERGENSAESQAPQRAVVLEKMPYSVVSVITTS